MKSKRLTILFLSFGLFLAACTGEIKNYQDYLAYLSVPENGFVKEKSVAGLKMQAKYLPVEYLAYNEINKADKKLSEQEANSIKSSYNNSVTFMLTLGPDDNEKFDITKVGVANYEEFAERVQTMNFDMADYLSLEVGGKEYKADLARMENLYGLKKERVILVVFNVENNESNALMKSDDVKLIYEDELFHTGINKFLFEKEDLNKLPKFIF